MAVLRPLQRAALGRVLRDGTSVFATGPDGSGKTVAAALAVVEGVHAARRSSSDLRPWASPECRGVFGSKLAGSWHLT